jgi:aspartate aminotransferase
MAATASETYTATSAPIQYAAVRAFEGGMRIERYLKHARRVLRALGRRCARDLRAAGVHVAEPKGAFYLFLDATLLADALGQRGITTSDALCERLLEDTGVAVIPGRAFGRVPGELTARLAYVDFDGASALAAAETIPEGSGLDRGDFLEIHAGGVLEAVERIAGWLGE